MKIKIKLNPSELKDYVRDEQKDTSDVDILVEFEKGKVVYKEYKSTCRNYKDNGEEILEEKTYGFWFCDLMPKGK